jgi:hypothetical protein
MIIAAIVFIVWVGIWINELVWERTHPRPQRRVPKHPYLFPECILEDENEPEPNKDKKQERTET